MAKSGACPEGNNVMIVRGSGRCRGPWRNVDAVEYATLDWVDWFNHRRLLKPIGDAPPAEYEMAYYRQVEESAMAA